jgi:chromosome segregation ATPase
MMDTKANSNVQSKEDKMPSFFKRLFNKKEDENKYKNEVLKLEQFATMQRKYHEEITKEFEKIRTMYSKLSQSSDTNSTSIAYLSQSITVLAQTMKSLSDRIRTLEDWISLSNIKFKKKDMM